MTSGLFGQLVQTYPDAGHSNEKYRAIFSRLKVHEDVPWSIEPWFKTGRYERLSENLNLSGLKTGR